MVVLEVLGVGLWAVLGLVGAWWLVTGRRFIFGLPKGMKEGWPMRVMGLAYFLVAVFLIYQAFHGSFSPEVQTPHLSDECRFGPRLGGNTVRGED